MAEANRRHPPEGAWRAYADGELPATTRWRLRTHAARCARCRERLAEVQGRGERVSSLLRTFTPVTDLGESWARLSVLARRPSTRGISRLSAFLAGGLAAASVAASILLVHPGPTRVLSQFHGLNDAGVLDECCASEPELALRSGVLTLASNGAEGPLRVHYTDLDGSGGFSPGDLVRAVSRVPKR